MAEKRINGRIVLKHDIESNWKLATGFTPMAGEVIIYDIDENYSYERIKIGDGVQNVNDLPFYASSWNDLTDKPFGSVEGQDYIVEEQSIVLGKAMGGTETYVPTTRPFSEFVEGQVYYIVFDGEVYPAEYDSDLDGLNVDTVDLEIYYGGNDEMTVFTVYSDPRKGETHTFGMYVTELVTAQLDEKYIPDTIARMSDIPVTNTSLSVAGAPADAKATGDAINAIGTLVGDKSVSEQINEAAVNNQSDWSVNDETSPAYVKNRTHWVSVEHKVWINNETLLFENFNGAYINQIALDEQILSVGYTYDIVIDDESYNCVAYEFEGMVCLGNLSIMDSSLTNTNESFFMYSPLDDGIGGADGSFIAIATSLDGDSHTITLAADVTTYHKIDENYLPHIVGRPGERIGSEIFNDYKNNFAGGAYAHAEGYSTWASGYASHAEGELTKATFENAHAEGNETTASGSNSHAEGNKTTASSYNAHAEGNATVASGHSSHAEGLRTEASGQGSHAEGHDTKASAYSAHAEGYGTEAAAKSQHVFGEYNIVDKSSGEATRGKYIQIAGNGGSANAKSNAYTLDWYGNAWFKGAIKIGGTGQDDEAAKELATQEYVQSFLPKITTITLPSSSWTGDANPWSQVVTVNGVTANSKIDLQPTAVQIVEMQNNDIALIAENNDGVVTVYAIGGKPTKDYTMQALITEVTVV